MKYKILTPIALILFAITFLNPVFAQTTTQTPTSEEQELAEKDQQPVIQSSQGLVAEFKQYTQDPRSKKAKFEMILKANMTSDRVAITWQITGVSRLAEGYKDRLNISIETGKTYTLAIEVIPTSKGVSEVYGKAEAFGVDGSQVATVRKNFASNTSGEILPITNEYKNAQTSGMVTTIGVILVVVVLLSVFGFFGFRWFAKWYKADEVR